VTDRIELEHKNNAQKNGTNIRALEVYSKEREPTKQNYWSNWRTTDRPI
jgi:hypothetical protein